MAAFPLWIKGERKFVSIFDLYSKRQKTLRGDMPDVYTYDKLPEALKVQIVHVMTDALGNTEEYHDSYGCGPRVQAA